MEAHQIRMMGYPGTLALQSTALPSAITTVQQIDLPSIMSTMLPMMMVVMMVKVMGGAFGKHKEPVTATATSTSKKNR